MQHPKFLHEHHDITHLSGYHTPARARYFLELTSEDDLPRLHETYLFAKQEDLPLLVIGSGTNLLFAHEEYAGIIVKNTLRGWDYAIEKKSMYSYSTEIISQVAEVLEKKYGNPLWHRFIGLPGSIGGAVYGNAGCFGLETESNFVSAKVYDMDSGVIKILSKLEMQFGYRHSILKDQKNLFLISAVFDLSEKVEKYSSDVDNIYFREHKQPKGYCCGSFFKNPSKENTAGSLIEAVGLKGHKHGGASWSPLHANFLMSDGVTCTGQDLLELVRMTQEKVKKEKGIELWNEVQIIG